MDLKDKFVVITGATGGIGKALVYKLDKIGAKLILVAQSESKLSSLTKHLKSSKHAYFSCNLEESASIVSLGKVISEKYKTVDVLINCAGIGVYKPIEDLSLKEWLGSFNVNLNAAFILIKILLENLKRSDEAVVINMGSGNGVMPVAGRSVYCSTKFALRGLSLSLSEEFKGTNLSFILMTLGSVLTSFGPLTITEKQKEMEDGKGYLTPDSVSGKIIEVLESEAKEAEYQIYPSGYIPRN